MRDYWPVERDRQLTELWALGLPASEIGRRIGVTKNSAIGRARRLGLVARKSPINANQPARIDPRVIESVTTLTHDGMTVREIAKKIGVGQFTICKIRADHGLSKPMDDVVAKVRKMTLNGKGARVIAASLGVTTHQIQVIRKDAEIPPLVTRPKIAAPVVEQIDASAVEIIEPGAISARIIELPATRGSCTWLDGHNAKTFRKCENPAERGRSWCKHHLWTVYVEGSARPIKLRASA